MRIPQDSELVALEGILDCCGMEELLKALALIALEKSVHLQEQYPGDSLVYMWKRVGRVLDALSESEDIKDLP